jgi:hypothetical protein
LDLALGDEAFQLPGHVPEEIGPLAGERGGRRPWANRELDGVLLNSIGVAPGQLGAVSPPPQAALEAGL